MKRFTIKSLMIWVFVSIGLCIGFTVLSIGQNATTESGSTNEFPWDVNQDRVVNVLDLVLVSQNFGTNNPVADVTGDGTVNVLDLVLVAQHFGETIPEVIPDVLIYTFRSFWITLDNVRMAADTTKRLLESEGIEVRITDDDRYLRDWMLQTTSDGSVNVLIVYGVIPSTVYPQGNSQPDGSIAENWIETTDGDTILNHADYIAYNSDRDVTEDVAEGTIVVTEAVGSNADGGLQNLMDNPHIRLGRDATGQWIRVNMIVTSDGTNLTPSLFNFESDRPIILNQLQGDWFAEKVFASDTGDAQATYADPVIVRDGNRGRLAIVHNTASVEQGLLDGEVAAEIIYNYLLAE